MVPAQLAQLIPKRIGIPEFGVKDSNAGIERIFRCPADFEIERQHEMEGIRARSHKRRTGAWELLLNGFILRLKLLRRTPEMLRSLGLLRKPVLILVVRGSPFLRQIQEILGRLRLHDQSLRFEIMRTGHAHGLVVNLQIGTGLLNILQKLARETRLPESRPWQEVIGFLETLQLVRIALRFRRERLRSRHIEVELLYRR